MHGIARRSTVHKVLSSFVHFHGFEFQFSCIRINFVKFYNSIEITNLRLLVWAVPETENLADFLIQGHLQIDNVTETATCNSREM